ncbi:MAG: AzlD domain-containing protein [Solirubrobacterales bacterium]|nr:AzlD domain-containing protein [Solirubrobacterales bacterium]
MSDSTAWTLVAILAIVTFALKSTGPIITGGRVLPPRVAAVIAAMPAALLAALVVTGTLTETDGSIRAGADTLGVLAGCALVWRTGVLLHGVVVALLLTAGLRLVT